MNTFFFDKAIDDDFDGVTVVFVKFDRVAEFADFAVNAHAHEALAR